MELLTDRQRSSTRRPDLDRLRVAACLLLFAFHTIEVFDVQPAYHIKSATPLAGLDYVSRTINAWHMPLFFLLAGMAAMYSIMRQPSWLVFVVGRIRRLMPPLILGLLTIARRTGHEPFRGRIGARLGRTIVVVVLPLVFEPAGGFLLEPSVVPGLPDHTVRRSDACLFRFALDADWHRRGRCASINMVAIASGPRRRSHLEAGVGRSAQFVG
jgi:hypothetical protein